MLVVAFGHVRTNRIAPELEIVLDDLAGVPPAQRVHQKRLQLIPGNAPELVLSEELEDLVGRD